MKCLFYYVLSVTFSSLPHRTHHHWQTRLGFIYSAYNEKYWWYEMVELARKYILNGLIGVMAENPLFQIIIGCAICFFFLMVIHRCNALQCSVVAMNAISLPCSCRASSSQVNMWVGPYKLGSDYALSVLAHANLFVTLFGGLLLVGKVQVMAR